MRVCALEEGSVALAGHAEMPFLVLLPSGASDFYPLQCSFPGKLVQFAAASAGRGFLAALKPIKGHVAEPFQAFPRSQTQRQAVFELNKHDSNFAVFFSVANHSLSNPLFRIPTGKRF